MTQQPIKYVSSPHFLGFPIAHGFFSRENGSSPPPYDSLNVSFGVGDSVNNVTANRKRIKKVLNLSSLLSSQQVHGETIAVVTEAPGADNELEGFDALITSVPGLGLMIQQADCQAVMLYDPDKKVVANIHCGWRGSVTNIVEKSIAEMVRTFDTAPADIYASISPSLGPCCAEFVNYKNELPNDFMPYQITPNYFDFWGISRDQLVHSGVPSAHIHIDGTCTVCNPEFFSYRRDTITGRGASVIGLL